MEASPKHTSPGVGAGAMASRLLMVQPDPVLCKLCARGSDDAFSVLHARYRQQVFAFVYHLLDRPGATDDAEDITQEVFSKAYMSIRTKNAEGSFKHWLFAIARNRTFDVIRARKPNSLPLEPDDETTELRAVGGSPAQAVETKQELAWLVGTVSGLPERQREALVMRELAGMSHAEIADALETSVPATKQLISRGRESVQAAATENGYRSRKLGRDLAMAAPLLPFTAFAFGASASSASAATAATAAAGAGTASTAAAASTGAASAASVGGVAGFGGLAMGTKIVATVAAVAVVGGGAVATERVVSGGSAEPAAAVTKNGATSGGPNANASSQAFISVAEARQRQAAARKKAAEKRAEAKAKAKKRRAKAKAKAKAKREKAAKRKELNANANGGGAGSTNSKAQTNGGGSGGSSEQPASSDGGNSGGSVDGGAGGGSGGNAGGGGNSGGNGNGGGKR